MLKFCKIPSQILSTSFFEHIANTQYPTDIVLNVKSCVEFISTIKLPGKVVKSGNNGIFAERKMVPNSLGDAMSNAHAVLEVEFSQRALRFESEQVKGKSRIIVST